jgi:hypothetical protein
MCPHWRNPRRIDLHALRNSFLILQDIITFVAGFEGLPSL